MSFKVHNESSPYGLSWFCSPSHALLWIGVSGRQYPHSFELWPLCTDPSRERLPGAEPNVDFGLALEAIRMMKHFSLNPHYYKFELTLQWIKQ